jgi:CheY-like chemotaxis protein
MAKLLLIEDDPLMNRMYRKVFASRGFEVDVAHDGEEGLKKVFDFMPNLILLDIMMPKINGMEVLKQLKDNPKTKNIKVILLTNLGIEEEIKRAEKLGAVRCLIKSDQDPIKVADVVIEELS